MGVHDLKLKFQNFDHFITSLRGETMIYLIKSGLCAF